jgi:hypothetical protein
LVSQGHSVAGTRGTGFSGRDFMEPPRMPAFGS